MLGNFRLWLRRRIVRSVGDSATGMSKRLTTIGCKKGGFLLRMCRFNNQKAIAISKMQVYT
jgi:hypothetical protein